jgi:hypothetical protein
MLPPFSTGAAKDHPDASKRNVAIKHIDNTYFFIFMFQPPW